jgi:hypothetical protein
MDRARGAEQADQRVGHDLDYDYPARQHEQREQEELVSGGAAGRDKQQASGHHHQQADSRAAHVADALDQLRPGDTDHEVGGEEAELNQHRLRVVEREQFLQLGQDHVIEAGDAAEDEEQREDEVLQVRRVDRGTVVGEGIGIACRCDVRCQCHATPLPCASALGAFP